MQNEIVHSNGELNLKANPSKCVMSNSVDIERQLQDILKEIKEDVSTWVSVRQDIPC